MKLTNKQLPVIDKITSITGFFARKQYTEIVIQV